MVCTVELSHRKLDLWLVQVYSRFLVQSTNMQLGQLVSKYHVVCGYACLYPVMDCSSTEGFICLDLSISCDGLQAHCDPVLDKPLCKMAGWKYWTHSLGFTNLSADAFVRYILQIWSFAECLMLFSYLKYSELTPSRHCCSSFAECFADIRKCS